MQRLQNIGPAKVLLQGSGKDEDPIPDQKSHQAKLKIAVPTKIVTKGG
jgi:hypothetical protein